MALRTRFLLLGWRQLNHNRLRFLAAVAGITFAVLLMLMQHAITLNYSGKIISRFIKIIINDQIIKLHVMRHLTYRFLHTLIDN